MIKQSTNSGGIFGLDVTRKDASIVIIPVGWEVTTSYGSGTSRGPEAILAASAQVDLYDIEFGESCVGTVYCEKADHFFVSTNDTLKPLAQKIIAGWDETGELDSANTKLLEKINAECATMCENVYKSTKQTLAENKIPGLIGGDHSTPLGAIRAVCEKYKGDVGILHIDAHADLRLAYQGFQYSHASIMRNVCALKTPPQRLVQVGIRDFCAEENDFILANEKTVRTFFDNQLKTDLFNGETWAALVEKMIRLLPQNVYVSFDIDGLSPDFCPHTGTPVPGGLSFDQATFLLAQVARSGRKIVGFDLNEVAPGPDGDEWDGNVGARMLFKLCGWAVKTNGSPSPGPMPVA
jgi:agmatinase